MHVMMQLVIFTVIVSLYKGYLSELFYAIVSRQVLKVHYRIFKGVDYYWILVVNKL